MAVRRLGSHTTDSALEYTLAIADGTYIASVIATNTTTIDATVSILIKPFNSGTTVSAYSYLAVELLLSAGQSFETFRFALESGDEVVVQSVTGTVNFTATAIYESEGRSNITVSPIQPSFPTVGDIWLNSTSNEFAVWNTSDWATVASATPAGPQGNTGPTGPTGPQGTPSIDFSVLGTVALIQDLPSFGTLFSVDPLTQVPTYASAYYVTEDGNIYAWRDTGWANIGPIVGPTGPQAVNFTLLGEVYSLGDLPTTPPDVPSQNGIAGVAAYYVTTLGLVYIWNGLAWVSVGPVIGPTGPTGPAGEIGPQGSPALAFTLLGSVALFENLPSTGNTTGDAYYVLSQVVGPEVSEILTGLYVWTGTEWSSVPYILGPTGASGTPGTSGVNGDSAYEIAVANGFAGDEASWLSSLVGPIGPTGANGVDGAAGAPGTPGDATAYTPTTAADWDVTPTTIAGALDELAARLRILEP